LCVISIVQSFLRKGKGCNIEIATSGVLTRVSYTDILKFFHRTMQKEKEERIEKKKIHSMQHCGSCC
jgi:hypothetical protein